tara:strand:+ start:1119 stop:3128 length:2010 start_codon:yes stop_codon:yes gene_type:complete
MATITITPGESFDPTEAVTSTKLNDLGSPTAALTPGSIGTADIADDAITIDQVNANAVGTSQLIDDSVNSDKILDSSVIESKIATDAVTTGKIEDLAVTTDKIGNGQVTPSKLSTGAPTWTTAGTLTVPGDSIEINAGLVADDDAYIDFHSSPTGSTNYEARIYKDPGENSSFSLRNAGTGSTYIQQDGENKFVTQGGEEGYTTIAGGGTASADGAKISLYGSGYPSSLDSDILYNAERHIFRNSTGGTNPSYVQMNMTDAGLAELGVFSDDTNGEANLKLSSFTPSIIFEDRTTSTADFQITANGGVLRVFSGDTSGDAPLTNEIVTIKSTDEVEIKGNLLINNVVDKPAILIEDTKSGTIDSEGEIAVPVGESFSLGFWDAAAAAGSRFISKLRFDSSWIYLRSKLRIGGTTDDAGDPIVYLDGIRENTVDELRLSADKLTFYTDTNYATKVIDATDTKVSINIPLEVSTISGPEYANVLTLRADPESPDPSNGGAQISLHATVSGVPNQIYFKSSFIYFDSVAASPVRFASINPNGPQVDKDLTTKEYVDEYALKYSGSTGTKSVTTSFADWDLSSVVGANRAMVIIEMWDTSTNINLMLKTKGSYVQPYQGTGFAGYGASGAIIATANQGGTFVVITDASGVIELKANASASGINYKIQAYQKLA